MSPVHEEIGTVRSVVARTAAIGATGGKRVARRIVAVRVSRIRPATEPVTVERSQKRDVAADYKRTVPGLGSHADRSQCPRWLWPGQRPKPEAGRCLCRGCC